MCYKDDKLVCPRYDISSIESQLSPISLTLIKSCCDYPMITLLFSDLLVVKK